MLFRWSKGVCPWSVTVIGALQVFDVEEVGSRRAGMQQCWCTAAGAVGASENRGGPQAELQSESTVAHICAELARRGAVSRIGVDPEAPHECACLRLADGVPESIASGGRHVIRMIRSSPQDRNFAVGTSGKVILHGGGDAGRSVHSVHGENGCEDAQMLRAHSDVPASTEGSV